jgi:putative chitinase
MLITPTQFLQCFPGHAHAQEWADAINTICPQYDITPGDRLNCFLAQCGHECEGFTVIKENLNYSAEALTKTWPLRFPPTIAAVYARQPEKIANRAYENRMGNGDESSGDGYKYRGRGCIQLTGKSNYAAFAKRKSMTLDEVIPYLETRQGALESACYYWLTRCLNDFADHGDMKGLTKAINGGYNGLQDRLDRYEHVCKVMNGG